MVSLFLFFCSVLLSLVPRQPLLPAHPHGRGSLAALLGCVSPVAGGVKLQDDGVVYDPVDGRGGDHGLAKMRSHSEKTGLDVMHRDRRS